MTTIFHKPPTVRPEEARSAVSKGRDDRVPALRDGASRLLRANGSNYKFALKQRGQGLIETIMIALFVGINVVTLISFQSYLAYNTGLTQEQSYANLLARSEMETLRDYSTLTAYQNIATGSNAAITLGNTAYTTSWTVTTAAGLSYKTIALTVSWTDTHGNAQSITLDTNIAGIDPSLPAAFM